MKLITRWAKKSDDLRITRVSFPIGSGIPRTYMVNVNADDQGKAIIENFIRASREVEEGEEPPIIWEEGMRFVTPCGRVVGTIETLRPVRVRGPQQRERLQRKRYKGLPMSLWESRQILRFAQG